MTAVKGVLAVLAGFIAVFALSMLTDLALEKSVLPDMGTPFVGDPLLALALAYRLIYTVAAGWIAARLAPRHAIAHAIALGVIGTLAALAGVVMMWSFGHQWYPIALVLTAIPCTWLGGRLAAPVKRPSTI